MITKREYKKASTIVQTYNSTKQDKDDKIFYKKIKKLIGNCYRYRNSYSGGDDNWWMYVEVVGAGEYDHRGVVIETFQKTTLKTEIERDTHSLYHTAEFDSGYQRISREEFNRGKQNVLNDLGLVPLRVKGKVKIK